MKLSDLDHFRDDKRISFKQENVNDEIVTIVSYMVGDKELWGKPLAAECRGIVFNSRGDCICRPFHKFFNVGELEDTQPNLLQGKVTEVLEKRDGSMLTPVLVGGKIVWKTKKSFYSEVAVEASQNVTHKLNRFALDSYGMGYTPIFEYTSPFNKIVLDYGIEPTFTLLALRKTESGEYANYNTVRHIALFYGLNLIQKYDLTLQDCLNQSKTLENFEGWCLRDPTTGFYVKAKTEWYLRNHRAQTDLRERDVADMVINETVDDIKSALSLDGFDLIPIEDIERRVVSELSEVRSEVETLVGGIANKTDFKEIARTFKDNHLFSLIMLSVRGKEPDYKKYWIQNFRENYSLKSVYNKNF